MTRSSQIVEGSHPVVYAAAGSHANYYDDALYLGTSGEQGFGCDDTRGPSDDLRPRVGVIPSDPAAARAAFPWIGYQGRWGQREESFYNGPTGPNTKDSWTHPISYQEQKGRDRQLRRAGRWRRRHLRHRLLLHRCVRRVRGRPQARRQPLAPAPDPGTDRRWRHLPRPPHHLGTGRTTAHRPPTRCRADDPRRRTHVRLALADVHRDRLPDHPGLPARGRAAEPDLDGSRSPAHRRPPRRTAPRRADPAAALRTDHRRRSRLPALRTGRRQPVLPVVVAAATNTPR